MGEITEKQRRLKGWRIVLACIIAQNLALGLALGSFGPLLASTQAQFAVSRTVASSGLSVLTLAMAGLGPFLGAFMERTTPLRAMIAGAALSAIGYIGLAFLPSFNLALPMYALTGAGVSLLAIIGPISLITNYFADHRGKLLAVINLPIGALAAPLIVSILIPQIGRPALVGGLGGLFALFIPLLVLLMRDVGKTKGSSHAKVGDTAGDPARADQTSVLTNRRFWLLTGAVGVMAGSGMIFAVHIVPFAVGRGMTLAVAAGVLSCYAAAGIVGNLAFGWVADRLRPPAALAISTTIQAFAWWVLPYGHDLGLFVLAAILGLCELPMTTLHGAALGEIIGPRAISRAMGISFALQLPFIVLFAPAAAYLFDHGGSYVIPFRAVAVLLLGATGVFILLALPSKGRQLTKMEAG